MNSLSQPGLLQGIRIDQINNSSFYSSKLDLSLSRQMLKSLSTVYDSAVKDVQEGNEESIEDYFKRININAVKFIMEDELYDCEEIFSYLLDILESKGNFVCVLGGKSTGKSLMFRHLEKKANCFSIVKVDMRYYSEKRNILDALLRTLSKLKTFKMKFIDSLKVAITIAVGEKASETKIENLIGAGTIMEFLWENKAQESIVLETLLTDLSKKLPNLTIIIDEANLAFDPMNSSDEILNKVKADLQVFTVLTKQTNKVSLVYLNSHSLRTNND